MRAFFRSRVDDSAVDEAVAPELDNDAVDLPPIGTASEQLSASLASKALSALLAVCLVSGPLAAAAVAFYLVRKPTTVAPAAASPASDLGERAVVGEFAVRMTVAWLTATKDHPGELPVLVRTSGQEYVLPQKAFAVTNPAVAAVTAPADRGIWSVTVAATVTDLRQVTARRYYQVPVSYTQGVVTALAPPSPTSAPSIGVPPQTAYRTDVRLDSPVGATVQQFLSAYLAGAGDISRYVSPGVVLVALQPAPYRGVEVTDLKSSTDPAATPTDDDRIQISATVTMTVAEQQATGTSYALTLTARSGRWEISDVDSAPLMSASQAASGPPRPPTPTPVQTATP